MSTTTSNSAEPASGAKTGSTLRTISDPESTLGPHGRGDMGSSETTPPNPPNPFPTTLADLTFHRSSQHLTTNRSIYATLKSLRHSTLSLHNRMTSILCDSHFVTTISTHYSLPLVANERCGSWYIPPHLKAGSVYFKSTDGHHGQWALSLRRLNLQLLGILGERGGAVVVDSTRRGKGMSDALMKTVPIWVAVVNSVLFEDEKKWAGVQVPSCVGESERVQIEERLEGWCEGFRGLGLDLQTLRRDCRRPIKVVWAVNGEWDGGIMGRTGEDVNLLVLCSASRRVRGAETSEGGYIQGAADDSEAWSRGLLPDMFWEHQDALMETNEEELPELIERMVKEKKERSSRVDSTVPLKPTNSIFLGVGARPPEDGFDLVINCNGDSHSLSKNVLDLKCQDGKLGSNGLRSKLGEVVRLAERALEKDPNCKILVTCSTGKDLSVGVGLVLICLLFDDEGQLRTGPSRDFIDKSYTRKRLAWITSSNLEANPSRSTLQSVNSFLMDRPN